MYIYIYKETIIFIYSKYKKQNQLFNNFIIIFFKYE